MATNAHGAGCLEFKMKMKFKKTNGALAAFNAQAFLEHLDSERITLRRGEERVLRNPDAINNG